MHRRTLLQSLTAAALIAPAAGQTPTHAETRSLSVPFDHDTLGDGRFDLEYAILRPFERRKPTVFVVADGQQFYVSPAGFASAASPLFEDRFNVVGVFGRANAAALHERVGVGAQVNWADAYRFYRARQWVGDLDRVRRDLLGARGRIRLYGRSGGALLAHEYMAMHGRYVDAAFTQATVNHYLAGRLGLESDRFWAELGEPDRTALAAFLKAHPERLIEAAYLLQRQNFFVPHTELATARTALIAELMTNDRAALEGRAELYQVNAIRQMTTNARGAAIAVRLYEFYQPVAHLQAAGFRPDKTVMADLAAPMMALRASNQIGEPSMNFDGLRHVRGDVTLLAGRWDHTCDYRTQSPLAAFYPRARVALLDDNHQFHRLNEAGAAAPFVNAALQGFTAPAYEEARTLIDPLLWRGG